MVMYHLGLRLGLEVLGVLFLGNGFAMGDDMFHFALLWKRWYIWIWSFHTCPDQVKHESLLAVSSLDKSGERVRSFFTSITRTRSIFNVRLMVFDLYFHLLCTSKDKFYRVHYLITIPHNLEQDTLSEIKHLMARMQQVDGQLTDLQRWKCFGHIFQELSDL